MLIHPSRTFLITLSVVLSLAFIAALAVVASAASTAGPGPIFTEITGDANPFNGVTMSFYWHRYSMPQLVDLDGDSDLDAVIGVEARYVGTVPCGSFSIQCLGSDPDGDQTAVTGTYFADTVRFYRNDGTYNAPLYTEIVGDLNPFNGVDVGHNTAPALADLDGDGDLDALFGEDAGVLHFYRNIGTATAPVFTRVAGVENPFDQVDVGTYSAPALGDLDGDSDLDAVIGEEDGVLNFYRNIGTAATPVFTQTTGADNPFNGVDLGYRSTPSLVDLDGDGDVDAVIGDYRGVFNYFRNDGFLTTPIFTPLTGPSNPFNGLDIGFRTAPALGDPDGDGDLDLLSGDLSGRIYFFRNAPPEIAVIGSGRVIVNGDNTPDLVDGTNFGGVYVDQSIIHTFVISNSGLGGLILPDWSAVKFTGSGARCFSVVMEPPHWIGPGAATSFQVRFTPSASEIVTATLSIASTDYDQSPYTFLIRGTGKAPEMAVIGGEQVIINGDVTPDPADATDFGDASLGQSITHTFTISNSGLGDLSLVTSPSISQVGGGMEEFVVTSQPARMIGPGAATDFKVRFTPSASGIFTGVVRILSNDYDNDPYTFLIRGAGQEPKITLMGGGQVIANGDNTPDLADSTDFGDVTLGQSITHTFTISNSGLGGLSLTASPAIYITGRGAIHFTVVQKPAHWIDPGAATTFQLRFTPSDTQVSTATLSIANTDSDQNPYKFLIRGVGRKPEMAVVSSGQVIVNGDATPDLADATDFGDVTLGQSITHTFTISNSGLGDLILPASPVIGLTGNGAGQFIVMTQPASVIRPGAAAAFRLRFTPSASGVFAATVTIANSDSDHNPYIFLIRGVGKNLSLYLPLVVSAGAH